MRIVRVVRRDEGSSEDLVLHPQLTVVRGATGELREWLVDTLGRIDGDTADRATGEVEASGVLLPMDAGSLDLLGIEGSVEGVVDAARLLARSPHDDPAAGEAAGADQPVSVGRREVDAGLDPVDSWFKESPSADHDDAPRLGSGDDEPGAALVRVGDDASADGGDQVPHTPLQRRIEALRDRRHELERLVGSIIPVDTSALREALAVLDEAPQGVPVAEAAELAEAWKDLRKDVQGLELGTTAEEREALAVVARAQEAVARAEAALEQPQLTDEQMARIEAAHAAHLEAAERVERRFGSGRARRQLVEAEAEEARLLGRHGFDSWVDFMLTASKRTEDPDMAKERAALDEARAELEVCVAELDAIPGAVGRRHRRTRIRERQDELSDRIARVLGRQPVGDDVESDLRNVTTPYVPVVEAGAVADALEDVGVEVADDLRRDPERLAERARQAVAIQARAEKRREELVVAVDALQEALSVLREAADAGATEVPPMPALPDMAEPPVGLAEMFDDDDAGIARLFDGEPAAELGPGPDDRPTGWEAPAPAAEVEVTDGVQGADGPAPADGRVPVAADAPAVAEEPAPPPGPSSPGDPAERAALVDDVHWEAMMAIAAARTDGPAGQLPVVFDDPFPMLEADECIELLARLARLTDHVQVVVVTDRPEVAEWAEAIGPDHASVVEVVA